MSITPRGVYIKSAHKRWRGAFMLIALAEVVLTVLVYISFAAHVIWPEKTRAAASGIPLLLPYEGRLTDTAGNAVADGTYCVRFSIYDNQTAGTKLWPTGTPVSTSTTVTSGVFSTLVGSSDVLSFNFASDTAYLLTEVNATPTTCAGAWEALSPRQRIGATGYAVTASRVYGDLFKIFDVSNLVQVGTGTGSSNPAKLALDVKNISDTIGAACSPSGTLWYNSANTRALVCDNGAIQEIGNKGTLVGLAATGNTAGTLATVTSGSVSLAGGNNITISQANGNAFTISAFNQSVQTQNLHNVTLSGNTAGVMDQISSGTMTLAGGNNITLSQNGNAVTISGANAAAAPTLNIWQNIPPIPMVTTVGFTTLFATTVMGTGGASSNLSSNLIFFPLSPDNGNIFPGNMTVSTANFLVSASTSRCSDTMTLSFQLGIYTLNGSTLSLLNSAAAAISNSTTITNQAALYSGNRFFSIHSSQWSASPTFSQGQYWAGLLIYASGNTPVISVYGGRFLLFTNSSYTLSGNLGVNSVASNTSQGFYPFLGRYSTNTSALPTSVGSNQLKRSGVADTTNGAIPYILFNNIGNN